MTTVPPLPPDAPQRAATRVQVLYFSPRDVLVPRVDRQCIMRFCESMAEAGAAVELVSLDVKLEYDEPTRSRDLFDVYGISTPFAVTIVPSPHRQEKNEVSSTWRLISYSARLFWRLLVQRRAFAYDTTVVYFVRRLLGRRVVLLFEIHVPPTNRLDLFLLRRVDGVLPVSKILARELREGWGIDEDRIMVAHMGTNLKLIEERRLDKDEARHKVGLPLDREVVVYTGKVHERLSEITLLMQTAKLLPKEVEMVIVGGREDHVKRLRERAAGDGIDNVRFVGFVAPGEVFAWQMAADVLVTYYPSGLSINKYRASPGKLFEYMASRRPIVTADWDALREALSPDAALFVAKDDPAALAAGISRILSDPELGERLAHQAAIDVQQFAWDRRAERVLEFAEQLSRR
jgi:glycosyltransferase involved in cell wall biosynthesis